MCIFFHKSEFECRTLHCSITIWTNLLALTFTFLQALTNRQYEAKLFALVWTWFWLIGFWISVIKFRLSLTYFISKILVLKYRRAPAVPSHAGSSKFYTVWSLCEIVINYLYLSHPEISAQVPEESDCMERYVRFNRWIYSFKWQSNINLFFFFMKRDVKRQCLKRNILYLDRRQSWIYCEKTNHC